jgi:hypothetical protein
MIKTLTDVLLIGRFPFIFYYKSQNCSRIEIASTAGKQPLKLQRTEADGLQPSRCDETDLSGVYKVSMTGKISFLLSLQQEKDNILIWPDKTGHRQFL